MENKDDSTEKRQTDDRSAMAKAMDRGTQVISACLAMVVPIFVGLWVDRRLKTVIVFTLCGLVFGMVAGIWSLMKLLKAAEQDEQSP